ncbi:hypothetical protein [Arthrobacter sp. JCM 19049]|uniref:hypothetical protein n=1 Tax=Arthrobacter sp. JCM 19049 TaxID=1460643 RepID=UPI000B108E63|nr:hypothetical protein [Arthrobacter sp. JCM 19049]
MRQLVAVEFLSVDGVMQGLGSPDEDRSGGFVHGGWGARYAPAIHAALGAQGWKPPPPTCSGGAPTRKWPPTGRSWAGTTPSPRT